MSALDWSMWLRSGAITGPPVQRQQAPQSVAAMGEWMKRMVDRMRSQEELARSVQLDRLVAISIADTTHSADRLAR